MPSATPAPAPVRVLHVLHASLPTVAGYTIRADSILRFQREQGLEPAVVTSAQHLNGDELYEEIHDIPHWRTRTLEGTPRTGVRELTLMRRLERRVDEAIRAFRPTLVHAHSPVLVGLPALWAARRHGLPMVYEVRDFWENASVDRGKFAEGSAKYRVARGLETLVFHGADAVVTICESLRSAIVPRAGKDPGKVFVVGNGVDPTVFSPRPASVEARRRWGVEGKRVLAYIGTFQPYEGLETLIAAMPRILAGAPDAHLLIAGEGGTEHELRAAVRAANLDAHVTFAGRVPHDEVRSIYALADLLVYPRTLTRTTALTTPLKPLEAMAMGRPVLVSDVPAMGELVQQGSTGLVFRAGDSDNLADQALAVLRDEARAAALGARGREWILARRTWPTLVAGYHAIYERARAAR